MNVQIRINKLVLYGFNYHDHRRIGAALERELATIISKNGAGEIQHRPSRISVIDAGSFKVAKDVNPGLIGSEIGRSVFQSLRSEHNLNLQIKESSTKK